jgi:heptosyltransferase-2
LELLAYPQFGELAAVGGCVHEVRPIESRPLAGFFAAGGILDPELAEYFKGCALIISFLFDPDRIFELNVRRCTQAQFIAGPYRPDEAGGRHVASVLLGALERLAIFDADPVPRLAFQQASERTLPGSNARVAFHPGSGSEQKNWPEERWSEFVGAFLEQTSAEVLLLGGEAEGERLDRLVARHAGPRVAVARSLPLVELAQRLCGCVAFVGHDSGITHLAAALGLRGLVLWGPSREAIWRPLSKRMTVIRAEDGLRNLSVTTVTAAAINLLSRESDEANTSKGG